MDMSPYAERLREELGALVDSAATEQREGVERLLRGFDPALRLTLMEMLADAAAEITAGLPSGSVEARLRGREVDFILELPPAPVATAAGGPGSAGGVGRASAPDEADAESGLARVTVRLPEGLKSRAEALAAEAGQSLNGYIVRAVRRETAEPGGADRSADDPWARPGTRHPSRTLSGWL